MLLPGETFPFTPLTTTEKQAVLTSCGDIPVNNPEYFRNFLAISGYPLIGIFRSYFVGSLARKSIVGLGAELTPETIRSFNRGALFYSGVLGVTTKIEKLPLREDVLNEIADADGQNFALDSYQTVQLEAASFCDLTEKVRPAMETEQDRLHQLALVGAGAVHLMVVRSIDRLFDSSAEALEAAHPELSDLF